uniref:Uncharacterized protein n=1 Tax=Lactuca sativa TaxID=4236 RepID=A0A9R1WEW2_LACSA|nr:hypothetical protein LSAT_V11C200086230 [Lactuca sativa]
MDEFGFQLTESHPVTHYSTRHNEKGTNSETREQTRRVATMQSLYGRFCLNPAYAIHRSGLLGPEVVALSDIDFASIDKNGCYEFIERFTGKKYEKLYYCQPNIHFPKDHFGNNNMQEWLEEHREEVIDNIMEEVIDDAGLIKEIEIGHLNEDEDEDENEDEDEDDLGLMM